MTYGYAFRIADELVGDDYVSTDEQDDTFERVTGVELRDGDVWVYTAHGHRVVPAGSRLASLRQEL